MDLFAIIAVLITAAALFGYLNERTLRLPTAIGVTLGALLLSLALLALEPLGVDAAGWAEGVLERVDFDAFLMEGILSFLLFAGSLHVDLSDLRKNRWPILLLATAGVVASTFLVGSAVWWALGALGAEIPYLWALLFGALISPTDPIAVLGILKSANTPKEVETLITGESLFNDGVGVVVFAALVGIAAGGGHEAEASEIALLFLEEAVGGIAFGLLLGFVAYHLLKRVDQYTVEIMITLAVVTGGYALALHLHTSGPLAMVVAGLFLGNQGRLFAMSDTTRENLDTFWELVDEILNAVLFVLIGLELLVIQPEGGVLVVGLVAIPLVLLARLLSVGATINLLRLRKSFLPYTVRLMTWGGLRGGISIALALSLPAHPARGLLVGVTYVVVLFSILVQGLTVGKLARRMQPSPTPRPAETV
jgi:CPA1 family monovalent cation:H+ antiporter